MAEFGDGEAAVQLVKEVGKGTGLGLSICYSIMKAHNGDLRFESDPSQGGTSAIITLPSMEEDANV